jgi:hypothetical protein
MRTEMVIFALVVDAKARTAIADGLTIFCTSCCARYELHKPKGRNSAFLLPSRLWVQLIVAALKGGSVGHAP